MNENTWGARCCWCSIMARKPVRVLKSPGCEFCVAMGRLFPDYPFQCRRGPDPAPVEQHDEHRQG
jgi:hypothetical protein